MRGARSASPAVSPAAVPAARPRQPAEALRLLDWLGWGSLVVPVVLAVLFGVASWRSQLDEARVRAVDNAILLQEYAHRLIITQDIALTAADEALRRFRPERNYDLDAHLFLQRLAERMGSGLGVGFVNPEGRFLVSSAAHPPPAVPRRRDYIEAGAEGVELFVDRVRIEPEGVDALVIARRPRGEVFTGVWVSALEITPLADYLARIAGTRGDSASLIRGDGRLLARNFPLTEPVVLGPETPAMRAIAASSWGLYEATAITDGVARIYAYQRVGDLPIYAHFGVSRAALLREWSVPFLAVTALLGALGAAGFQLTRYARRSVRAEAAEAALAFDRRLLAEAEKTAALRETMLRELNHRVKNSLQMIQSLIRMQRSRDTPDLDEISSRVMAIASIHDLLYRSSGAFEVDFTALLRALCENEAIRPPGGGVTVAWRGDPLVLDVSLATPLALCVVELVTNAAKHAFGPGGGHIEVSLVHPPGAATATLAVEDDGCGMPADRARSSGLRVVEALVAQVGGTLAVAGGEGTRVEIAFPVAGPEAAAG